MKKIITVFFCLLIIISSVFAEDIDISKPTITALIRTKAEQNLSIDRMNFYIRNARFGLKGNINEYLSYKMELDWQDEEEDQIQDIKLIFTPIKNFEFTIGQFKVPFANDYLRNPADFSFANRNFITKRMCKNLRDIGVMASYKLNCEELFPMTFSLGVFNGNGAFTTEVDSKKAVGAKIELSPIKNGSISFSSYQGEVKAGDLTFYDTKLYDLSFTQKIGDLFIDAEAGKKLVDDSIDSKYEGFYITVAYDFHVTMPIFYKITPALRFDLYNKTPDSKEESPRRFSAGLTFHLKENNNAYIRLDYENYDYKSGIDVKTDKVTLEYVVRI
jgi:hypothetical protein